MDSARHSAAEFTHLHASADRMRREKMFPESAVTYSESLR